MFDRCLYNDWPTPHNNANGSNKRMAGTQRCIELAPEDAVMASIAKLLGGSIVGSNLDTVSIVDYL